MASPIYINNGETYGQDPNVTAGRVGIGTTNPVAGLEIQSNSASLTQLYLTDTQAYSVPPAPGIVFRGKYDSSSNMAALAYLQGGKENTDDNDSAGMFMFSTKPDGGSLCVNS